MSSLGDVSREARIAAEWEEYFDGNGAIDIASQESLAPGICICMEDPKEAVAQVDSNHNGVIDFEEFMKMDGVEGSDEELTREAFNAFDKDNDGFVSAAEIREAMDPEPSEEGGMHMDAWEADGGIDFAECPARGRLDADAALVDEDPETPEDGSIIVFEEDENPEEEDIFDKILKQSQGLEPKPRARTAAEDPRQKFDSAEYEVHRQNCLDADAALFDGDADLAADFDELLLL